MSLRRSLRLAARNLDWPRRLLAALGGAARLVPLAGFEPARCCHHQILSLARLPVPPQGHDRDGRNQAAGIIAADAHGSMFGRNRARAF